MLSVTLLCRSYVFLPIVTILEINKNVSEIRLYLLGIRIYFVYTVLNRSKESKFGFLQKAKYVKQLT